MYTYLVFLWFRIKRRWLSLLLWSAIWVVIGILYASLFKTFSATATDFDTALKALPEALRNSFNIANNYLSSPESFLSGQFLTLYVLVASIYWLYTGVNDIAGKIADKTIHQWMTKKLSRSGLYFGQATILILSVFSSAAIIWTSLYLSFRFFSGQTPQLNYYIYACLGTALLFSAVALFGLTVGVLLPKRISQPLGTGVVVFMWFLNSLSSIDGYPQWLKPINLYHYFDVPLLRESYILDGSKSLVIGIVVFVCVVVGVFAFRKKSLSF